MTQRQQSHPRGTFPTCPACGFEARHFIDRRQAPVGGHFLSCACGDAPKRASLGSAISAWCTPRNVSLTVRPLADVVPLIAERRS